MMIGLKVDTTQEQAIQDIDNIKQEILTYIQKYYKKQYIGELNITRIKPNGYKVVFGLNVPERPLTIMAQLNMCDFIKFMQQEIKDRRLDFVKFFTGVQNYPEQCQVDTSCSCRKQN